jgi:hypothetical protein
MAAAKKASGRLSELARHSVESAKYLETVGNRIL